MPRLSKVFIHITDYLCRSLTEDGISHTYYGFELRFEMNGEAVTIYHEKYENPARSLSRDCQYQDIDDKETAATFDACLQVVAKPGVIVETAREVVQRLQRATHAGIIEEHRIVKFFTKPTYSPPPSRSVSPSREA